jgi:hypothetical protein
MIDLAHAYGRYGFRRSTALLNQAGSFAYDPLALMTDSRGPGSARSAASERRNLEAPHQKAASNFFPSQYPTLSPMMEPTAAAVITSQTFTLGSVAA